MSEFDGNCSNEYCYFNAFGCCCHESEEGHENATGELDCPSSLRKDFEKQFLWLFKECSDMLRKRSFQELIKIRKFILNQRN